MNFQPGDNVECFSSVGKQRVTVLETGLKVKNPFSGAWTDNMVLVQYLVKPGQGMAHENQLRRVEINSGELK
jgi:hypothetical protein